MADIHVLGDDKFKFHILTAKPADPAHPTAAELLAGIDASFEVLDEGFNFGPTESDVVQEKPLGSGSNAGAYSSSNGQVAFTYWRLFDSAGGFSANDRVHNAVKTKGTTLWVYGRQTDKAATLATVAGDELFYGAEIVTDRPTRVDAKGFIKYRVATQIQEDWNWITVPS